MTTRLSPNFTLEEFIRSDTARREKLDNTPDDAALGNLRSLAMCMQGVRHVYRRLLKREVAIIVLSAYRSPAVNVAAGGVPGTKEKPPSAHVFGCAVDYHVPSLTLYEAATLIEGQVPYDQLIYEHGRCVHIGFGRFVIGDQLRMQSLTQRGKAHSAFEAGLLK